MIPETAYQHAGDCLALQAKTQPSALFIEDGSGRQVTFGELDEAANRIGNCLRGHGVARGDRIAVVLENSIEFVESWIATSRIGAVFVPVNPAYRGDFLSHVVGDSGARIAILSARFLDVIREVESDVPDIETVFVLDQPAQTAPTRFSCRPYAELMRGSPSEIQVAITERDPALIVYTSGTTGPSKGVVLPHGSSRMNAVIYIDQMSMEETDRVYCCLPLFHTNALETQIFGALIVGCPVLLVPAFSASNWLRDVSRFGATITNMMGAMLDFVHQQAPSPQDSASLLRLICAVPVPADLGPAFEKRFGVRLVELYGTTETKISHCMPAGEPPRTGSCGRLVEEYFECRLVDPETEAEVPDGSPGEVLLRPRKPWTILLEYHNRPDATALAWRNLWYHTGDIMRRDQEGYYYFVDRLKDSIRRRGENISSFEVERVMLSHEAVAEAAVFGVPSPVVTGDQEVMAVIVFSQGHRPPFQEIEDFCETRLPHFAVPRFFEAVEALPKTPSQRVRKQTLKQKGIRPTTWRSQRVGWTRRDFESARPGKELPARPASTKEEQK